MTILSRSEDRAEERASASPPEAPRQLVLVRAVAGVAAVAGVLFYAFSSSDLWLDEALSVNIARLPLSQLHAALKRDGAPPLYYVMLHVWTSAFGTSGFAARSLSGLCMLAAVVTLWFVARRWLGEVGAWLTVIVFLANPFAYRYATESRMYALMVLLVCGGALAVQRAFDRPSVPRVAVFTAIVAIALYTQYWFFYLLPVVAILLAWILKTGSSKVAARRLLVGLGVGVAAFLPWVPTFMFQRAHTGTPWGRPMFPTLPLAYTLRDFAGGVPLTSKDLPEGWALFLILFPLLLLGVFARSGDAGSIEIDLRVPKQARAIAFLGGVGLATALSLNYVVGGAFQTRYSAIVFPFFVLLVARGLTMLRDVRILAGVLAAILVFAIVGGVRNMTTQRTLAANVASVLRNEAKPGDVVVYCPDQLGPSTQRLSPKGLAQYTYPAFGNPKFVNWIDYVQRLNRAKIPAFAAEAVRRAQGHNLWYVYNASYITHLKSCTALSNELARLRQRKERITSSRKAFERPFLEQFVEAPH